MLFSKHAHHPSSTNARTISLHLPLPSEPLLFPTHNNLTIKKTSNNQFSLNLLQRVEKAKVLQYNLLCTYVQGPQTASLTF